MGLLFCRCPLLARILRDVILCRPSVNVLMELTDLLFSLGKYCSIMATLCHGSGKHCSTFLLIAICRQWNESSEAFASVQMSFCCPGIENLNCRVLLHWWLGFISRVMLFVLKKCMCGGWTDWCIINVLVLYFRGASFKSLLGPWQSDRFFLVSLSSCSECHNTT
jgi:hypothetical protein